MQIFNFTQRAEGTRWNVQVDPVAQYGYFEPISGAEGGGLWFERKELMDYDGHTCLPKEVGSLLRTLGYTVSTDFD